MQQTHAHTDRKKEMPFDCALANTSLHITFDGKAKVYS